MAERITEEEIAVGVILTTKYIGDDILEKSTTVDGMLHDFGLSPAYICYSLKTYQPVRSCNCDHGVVKCKTKYYDNGVKKTVTHYNNNGNLHSNNAEGPSKVVFRSNGTVYSETWHDNGLETHRRIYDKTGSQEISCMYYEDGVINKVISCYNNRVISLQKNITKIE